MCGQPDQVLQSTGGISSSTPLSKRAAMHPHIKMLLNGRAQMLSVRKHRSTTLPALDLDTAIDRRHERAAEEPRWERSTRRLLIIGSGDAARILADELMVHFPTDYEVVGFVENDPGAITGNHSKILGSRAEIDDLARRH